MSVTSNGVDWVETTEEVVVTEECLPLENSTSAGTAKDLFSHAV